LKQNFLSSPQTQQSEQFTPLIFRRGVSSVSTVTMLRTVNRVSWFDSQQGKETCLFPKGYRPSCYLIGIGSAFLGIMRPRREAHHLPASNAEEESELNSTVPIRLHGVQSNNLSLTSFMFHTNCNRSSCTCLFQLHTSHFSLHLRKPLPQCFSKNPEKKQFVALKHRPTFM
jgi:hypothetical protein